MARPNQRNRRPHRQRRARTPGRGFGTRHVRRRTTYLKRLGNLAKMNSNHYRALTLRTLAAICLTVLLIAGSQAQTEAALKNDKDGSGVDIVVQGALDSEL